MKSEERTDAEVEKWESPFRITPKISGYCKSGLTSILGNIYLSQNPSCILTEWIFGEWKFSLLLKVLQWKKLCIRSWARQGWNYGSTTNQFCDHRQVIEPLPSIFLSLCSTIGQFLCKGILRRFSWFRLVSLLLDSIYDQFA